MTTYSIGRQEYFASVGKRAGIRETAELWLIRRNRSAANFSEQRLAGEREVEGKLEVQNYVSGKLRELTTLPLGWDGASGGPVAQEIADQAYRAIERIADSRTIYPFVTPGEEGSILFEWRAGVERLEIEFIPDEAPYVCYVDSDGLMRIQGALGAGEIGYGELRRALAILSSRIWSVNPGWKSLFS
ncbi:hypothetical protein [Streptomyces sp. t39]|uniref:hypothetical protein n=1 Tax=Streptomyces sp. t39 TaxID=1828156 RepID=UPI0011CDD023|nr:hypothetical protein [Streptomyces sp. t39]